MAEETGRHEILRSITACHGNTLGKISCYRNYIGEQRSGSTLTQVNSVVGLSTAEVQERIAQGLTNHTDNSSSRSVRDILKANILTRFNAVLGALFVVVMIAGSIADGLFGFLLLANSLIGIIQELIAKRKLDRLTLLHSPHTVVIRDGERITIATSDVVQGDLVEIHAGDQVPADGHVVAVDTLEVNEANLTGESDAIAKSVGDAMKSGTVVTAGSGRFIAEAVGEAAYANRIAAEAKVFSRTSSEIQASLDRLLVYITWAIVIATPLQLWSQFHVNDTGNWRDAVVRATGGLVGLVPEGLVLLTTLAFLTAAVQLTRQQVLVQELPAVEGLARVSVICLDKTGTLTTGKIQFEGLHIIGDATQDDVYKALQAIANDSNANDTLRAVAHAIPHMQPWPEKSRIPFNSTRKWQALETEGNGTWFLGAPEVLSANNTPALVQELASEGRRVLMLSRSWLHATDEGLPADLQPIALVALMEEIRPDAADTLAYLRDQGVVVKIISGDNPVTVGAIARRLGLDVGQPCDARTLGDEPHHMTDALRSTTVFGRVTPEQKRSIVQSLQESGEVVAMTGDGVNDALALKRSDIGIAMDNGAPATKAVAQLILLDGQFSHLPSVIGEGRRVIGNVERVANLFVAKNAMSFIAIVSAAILSMPFPLLPRHLTLLSSITIGIPAFVLALGPNPRRFRAGFLKRILMFAVPAGAIAGLTVVISDYAARGKWGVTDGTTCSVVKVADNVVNTDCWRVGSGATLSVLIVFFWILLMLARPLRAWKLALVCTMGGLGVFAFTIPFAREFFNFNLPTELMLQSGLIGAAGIGAIELTRRIQKRFFA